MWQNAQVEFELLTLQWSFLLRGPALHRHVLFCSFEQKNDKTLSFFFCIFHRRGLQQTLRSARKSCTRTGPLNTLHVVIANLKLFSPVSALSPASVWLNAIHVCPLTWAPPDSFSSSALQRCSSSSSSALSLWLLSYSTCSSCSSTFRLSHWRRHTGQRDSASLVLKRAGLLGEIFYSCL